MRFGLVCLRLQLGPSGHEDIIVDDSATQIGEERETGQHGERTGEAKRTQSGSNAKAAQDASKEGRQQLQSWKL